MEIIRETAINDEFTGAIRGLWHNQWGYGKINAYEGLRECIRLAAASGMNDIRDSETPVSLYRGDECWIILFNNEETEAVLSVYTLGGTPVMERKLSNIMCGHKEIMDLKQFEQGYYLLHIQTGKTHFARKIVVR